MIATIEQLVRREAQDRLDKQAKLFALPFRFRVGAIRNENAVYVLPVSPTRAPTGDDPKSEAAREMMIALLSYVNSKMEEEHPGLRILLLPEAAPTRRPPRRDRKAAPRKTRTTSKAKGR